MMMMMMLITMTILAVPRTTLTYRKLKLKSVGVAQFIPMSLVDAKNMNEGRDDDIIIIITK